MFLACSGVVPDKIFKTLAIFRFRFSRFAISGLIFLSLGHLVRIPTNLLILESLKRTCAHVKCKN